MGRGKYRPMLIKLINANDKALIFQNIEKLKQYNQGKQRSAFITDHLPEAWAERKRFIHYLKQQNKKLPVAQQKKVTVKNNTLFLDDEQYQAPLKAPTVSQFLNLSQERRKIIRELEVVKGDEEIQSESIFIGYAAEVFSIKQVEDHYYHVRLLSPEATHVMCAYKLPGVDFALVQGGIDDGEHGASRTLLNLLLKNMVENRALYVVRYYGGQHIGPIRFTAIENTAQSALDKLQNQIRRRRQPPTQEELDEFRRSIQDTIPQPEPPLFPMTDSQDETEEENDADIQSVASQDSQE